MGTTLAQRIADRMPWLDTIAEKVQPVVREAIDKGGVAPGREPTRLRVRSHAARGGGWVCAGRPGPQPRAGEDRTLRSYGRLE
jgi:hypothetical protein